MLLEIAMSLLRALDADPELRRDYLAFLDANREQIFAMTIQQLLAALLEVPDDRALAQLWAQVPLDWREPFIAAVEALIGQAEQGGEEPLAAAPLSTTRRCARPTTTSATTRCCRSTRSCATPSAGPLRTTWAAP